MKYLLVLAILLTSLCVGLPLDLPEIPGLPFDTDSTTEQPGFFEIDQGSPDLYLRVQTIPLEVKSDRNLTMILEMRNKNDFDLTDVTVEIYDLCIFDEGTYSYSPEEGTLSPNETKLWRWELTAGETQLEKNCEIKIKASYNSVYHLSQDLVVLSEGEYRIRELEGTLDDVPIQRISSSNPFYISLTFPEEQPFREDTSSYSMYLDYYKTGIGFIEVNDGNITIEKPDNLRYMSCEDYDGLVLNKNLRFIKNKALRTTCELETKFADGPMDIKAMEITANYKYTIDSSVSVKVRPSTAEDMPKPST
jgi:hypothetical protein